MFRSVVKDVKRIKMNKKWIQIIFDNVYIGFQVS